MSTQLQTLRDIEQNLSLLLEVDPDELPEELRAELVLDLQRALRESAEKRDRIAARLFDLGQRATVKRAAAQAHYEKAKTLEASAAHFESEVARLSEYVLSVLAEQPKPKRGVRILEGASATLKAYEVAGRIPHRLGDYADVDVPGDPQR
jgi:hypothetical protein